MLEGVDYAWGAVPFDALKAAGKQFAMRYISHDVGKDLTLGEKNELFKRGIGVGLVFESTAGRALGGRIYGVQDAAFAKSRMTALGLDDLPVYFAVDFDATQAQMATIHSYLAGASGVLGHGRVGVYGGYYVVRYCVQNSSCAWFWQTYAWSGGLLHPSTHIHQYKNGVRIGGLSCDLNRAMKPEFGVRLPGAQPPVPPDPPEEDMPVWFPAFLRWYILDRTSPAPAGVPADIPQWAYDVVGKVMEIHVTLGPPAKYETFRDWRLRDGGDPLKRPSGLPDTIPTAWWDAVESEQELIKEQVDAVRKGDGDRDAQVASLLNEALGILG